MANFIGAKAHSARLRALSGPEMKQEIGRALFVAGSQIAVEAQTSITAGSVSGKGHVASQPGQPPSADTRVLDLGIIVDQPETLRVRVISQASYSAALEYGTSRMQARPFMRPALAKRKAGAIELVRAAVQRVVSQGRLQAVGG